VDFFTVQSVEGKKSSDCFNCADIFDLSTKIYRLGKSTGLKMILTSEEELVVSRKKAPKTDPTGKKNF
jgi:hypothetical protein